jgi:hypothetical protein
MFAHPPSPTHCASPPHAAKDFWKSAVYFACTDTLTDEFGQQPVPSTTATQSESVVHDWS